jgi:hypothetical protein
MKPPTQDNVFPGTLNFMRLKLFYGLFRRHDAFVLRETLIGPDALVMAPVIYVGVPVGLAVAVVNPAAPVVYFELMNQLFQIISNTTVTQAITSVTINANMNWPLSLTDLIKAFLTIDLETLPGYNQAQYYSLVDKVSATILNNYPELYIAGESFNYTIKGATYIASLCIDAIPSLLGSYLKIIL